MSEGQGNAAAAAGSGVALSTGTEGNGAAPDWGGASPGDFHSLLPQDMRAEPAFANFKGPVKEVMPKFAKSMLEGQRFIGVPPEQIVRLPKADADAAAWDPVWTRLGRPDSPDKYELKAPDGITISPKLDAVARAAFHKAGISAKAATQIYQEFTTGQKAEYDAMMAERKAETAKTETAFKGRWGDKFDEELNASKMIYGKLFSPDLQKALTAAGFDSHPGMIEAMNRLSHTISFKEDKMLSGDASSMNQGRDISTVESDIQKLQLDLSKMKDKFHPEYKAKQAQLVKLFDEGANLKYGQP